MLRKAYGGAYIVMDSKGLGNDWCVAWPTAEIAVMGAPPARCRSCTAGDLAAIDDDDARGSTSRPRSRPSTRTRFANPYVAAERGFVDDVIAADRHAPRLADALARSATKREQPAAPPPLATPRSRSRKDHRCCSTDKRILVTGVLNDASIAFSVARLAQEQGAEVVLTSFGRVMRLTERAAERLPTPTRRSSSSTCTNARRPRRARRRASAASSTACVHSIGFAPESCLGGGFLDAPWEDVAVALQVSAYSLKALAVAALPLMSPGGSIVGLDFDNDDVAWPVYDWMGVAKAALESTARYLARDLGPQGHPGQPRGRRARSARSRRRASPASRRSRRCGPSGRRSAGTSRTPSPSPRPCVALLSDWFPATTGEIVHVDGGFHAVGA